MGIESVFKSIAGADFKAAEGGGLSASEFAAFLKDKAGADANFVKDEFSKVASSFGRPGSESNAILEAFGKDGQISVDKFRNLLEQSAGSDKAFNLDELKGGLEKLSQRAEDKLADAKDPAADFRKDAGADKSISKDEFKAIAERAGVDEKTAAKAFDKMAGGDDAISKDEFKEAFGDTKVGKDALAKKMDKLGGEEKGRSEDDFAKFGRDAGADGEMDMNEFKALAEKAGVEGEDASKAFDTMAGADGKLSKDEFKAKDGFGAGKVSEEDFKSKVEDLAGDDECGCDDKQASESNASGSGAPETTAGEKDCDDPSKADWSVEHGANGQSTVELGEKYSISMNEADSSWTVTNNETGEETKISGDPHVDVGNDGKNDFDFKKDMTFQLDDGTKITVDTIDAGNGTTLSSGLTITNGDNAIQVEGLATGGQDGNLAVTQSMRGEEADQDVADGLTIDEAGSGWTDPNGDVVDQELINKAEA